MVARHPNDATCTHWYSRPHSPRLPAWPSQSTYNPSRVSIRSADFRDVFHQRVDPAMATMAHALVYTARTTVESKGHHTAPWSEWKIPSVSYTRSGQAWPMVPSPISLSELSDRSQPTIWRANRSTPVQPESSSGHRPKCWRQRHITTGRAAPEQSRKQANLWLQVTRKSVIAWLTRFLAWQPSSMHSPVIKKFKFIN